LIIINKAEAYFRVFEMFVEELLFPLTVRGSGKGLSEGSPNAILENLLRHLERRPISALERKTIQNEVISFIKDNNMKLDDPVPLQLSNRLGYSYLPFVCNLGLTNSQVEGKGFEGEASPHDTHLAPIVPLPNEYSGLAVQPARAGLYYICTIRRIKSPLSTSYKMYLDNIRDLKSLAYNNGPDGPNEDHSTGKGRGIKPPPTSVAILGARKMKSGIALVWADTEDTREWKDKAAVGRIFRSEECNYSGRIQFTGKAPSSPDSSRAASPVQAASSAGDSPPISGPIVCAVRSKGMDKLIHVAAVASPNSDVDEGAIQLCLNSLSSSSSASHTGGAHPTSAPIAAGAVPSSPLPPGCLRLHSKLPRKVSAGGRKEIHSVAFGKMSRVRAPSRKNIVIDRVADEGTANNEWTSSGSDIPPIFQVSVKLLVVPAFFLLLTIFCAL
jgi:hypothetical protein